MDLATGVADLATCLAHDVSGRYRQLLLEWLDGCLELGDHGIERPVELDQRRAGLSGQVAEGVAEPFELLLQRRARSGKVTETPVNAAEASLELADATLEVARGSAEPAHELASTHLSSLDAEHAETDSHIGSVPGGPGNVVGERTVVGHCTTSWSEAIVRPPVDSG